MKTYYTYFDHNYAVRAVAMYRSLRRNSGPLKMYMLCLDGDAHAALDALRLPDVVLLTLSELEGKDPELLRIKGGRSIVEYYFTLTSCLGWYIMQTDLEIEILTYLDSDLFFYGEVAPIFSELAGKSIGVTYHCFPEYGPPRQGRYNVGWVSWRRDRFGMECLEEYRRLCIEWCYLREEDGRYADQVYLDAWEAKTGFHAIQHRGANVAAWNLGCYRIGYDRDPLTVDGYPLVFFHFHKFSALNETWFDTNLWYSRYLSRRLREKVVFPYIAELRQSGLLLPMTGSQLQHFPYRHGLARGVRNVVRFGLALLRRTYVYYPVGSPGTVSHKK